MEYIVKFEPDNNWGAIVETTNNKEEAYKIYHKIKADMDIRPGHLFILQVNDDGKQQYLCNYKTGKNKDGLAIIEEMKRLAEQLMALYDKENLRRKQSEYDKLSADIMHGIEIIDFTKIDADEVMKKVFQQQKVLTNTRRQYKYLMKDAIDVEQQLEHIFSNICSAERILKKNEKYRNSENTNEKIKYLEKIGIDINEYFKEEE